MSEWKVYKLGDACTELSDGLHKAPIFVEGGDYIFVNAKNIAKGFIVDNDPTKKSTKEEYLKYSSPLNETTILYSIDGTIGNIALYRGEKCILGKGACYMNPNPQILDRMYLYYTLQSPHFNAYIDQMSTGSTIQHISLKTMRNYVFTCPPLDEQKQIASVLSSLDDKIDLLNRENATLEAMAETLFRQWFIEEAKEDWEEGKLGDLIEVKYGKDHKKLQDGNIPVFGSGGIMRYADTALYDKESVLIPRKGSLNNVMYINEPFWTVDTMFYTEMRRPNIAKFIYHIMKGQDLANMNVGSAVPSMTTEVLNNIPLDIPSQDVFDKFEDSVVPLYNKKEQNNKQIKTLIHTRDGLIPKLMSDEVKM